MWFKNGKIFHYFIKGFLQTLLFKEKIFWKEGTVSGFEIIFEVLLYGFSYIKKCLLALGLEPYALSVLDL